MDEHPRSGEAVSDRRSVRRIGTFFQRQAWLGSEPGRSVSFVYWLEDVSASGVGIRMEASRFAMAEFAVGSRLYLHLPFRLTHGVYDGGRIVRVVERGDEVFCGIALESRQSGAPSERVFELSLGADAVEPVLIGEVPVRQWVARSMGDLYFLKRGVLIYLDHLVPLFTRAATVRGRLTVPEARRQFASLRSQLAESVAVLEGYCRELGSDPVAYRGWDLSDIRRVVTMEFLVEDLALRYRTREVRPYLRSIRLLDHRLYTQFNTLVVLVHMPEDLGPGT